MAVKKKTTKLIFRVPVIFMLFFFQGCNDFTNLCDTEMLDELSSVNDGVNLHVNRKNCGATTSYLYSIYLFEGTKNSYSESDLILRAEKVDNLNVKWVNRFKIEITADSARVQHFKNYFWKNVSSTGYDEIKIKFFEGN